MPTQDFRTQVRLGRTTFKVLVFEDQGQWIGMSLEKEVVTQVPRRDLAADSVMRLLIARTRRDRQLGREPLGSTRPAAAEYFERYKNALEL